MRAAFGELRAHDEAPCTLLRARSDDEVHKLLEDFPWYEDRVQLSEEQKKFHAQMGGSAPPRAFVLDKWSRGSSSMTFASPSGALKRPMRAFFASGEMWIKACTTGPDGSSGIINDIEWLNEHFPTSEWRSCFLSKRFDFEKLLASPDRVEVASGVTVEQMCQRLASAAAQCAGCAAYKPLRGHLQACSKCLAAHYCGKQCQTAHWNEHKDVCRAGRPGAAAAAAARAAARRAERAADEQKGAAILGMPGGLPPRPVGDAALERDMDMLLDGLNRFMARRRTHFLVAQSTGRPVFVFQTPGALHKLVRAMCMCVTNSTKHMEEVEDQLPRHLATDPADVLRAAEAMPSLLNTVPRQLLQRPGSCACVIVRYKDQATGEPMDDTTWLYAVRPDA